MTVSETYVSCAQCDTEILPEDAAYDDYMARYYCDMTCVYDWIDEGTEVVVEYYVKLNITG